MPPGTDIGYHKGLENNVHVPFEVLNYNVVDFEKKNFLTRPYAFSMALYAGLRPYGLCNI